MSEWMDGYVLYIWVDSGCVEACIAVDGVLGRGLTGVVEGEG